MNRLSLFLGLATFSFVLTGCPSDPVITIDAAVGDAGRDSGMRDAALVCTAGPLTVPAPTTVACTEAEGRCILAAGTNQTALTACLEALSDACDSCTNQQLLSCATSMGCNDEFGCFNQCVMAGCSNTPGAPCTGTGEPCAAPFQAMLGCIQGLAGACSTIVTPTCFPTITTDGGVTDAAVGDAAVGDAAVGDAAVGDAGVPDGGDAG